MAPRMSSSQIEILKKFIEDEALHYPRGEQSPYFPSNHHRITPLVARAPKLLPRDKRVDLYFHLLRLNHFPAIKSVAEFDPLLDAYARIRPLFKRGYPYCSMPRPMGFFLFGIDDHGSLVGEPRVTYVSLLAHLKFWRYAGSFSHMPGMLKKQQRFLELSGDSALVDRVTKTLLRINLVDDLTTSSCLWFWSFMLLAIQDIDSGKVAVEWLLQAKCPPSERSFFLENLTRYLRTSSRKDLLSKFQGALKHADK
ncbi:MAG: hypothetical protein IPQ26_03015 [Elusimicrobia bacterium]|nr:hypothetical protein [Elusimicrobiota bacterium]